MGICFVYDIPAALNKMIKFVDEENTEYNIVLLYSAYALPNIIMPMVFGWAAGLNLTIVSRILSFLVFFGHLIFTIGLSKRSFSVMIIGRIILGIGGESISVIQNKMISSEYKGKDLSFAMGLFSSLARLGTILTYLVTPYLGYYMNPNIPCYVGIFITLNGMVLYFLEEPREGPDDQSLVMIPSQANHIDTFKTVSINDEEVNLGHDANLDTEKPFRDAKKNAATIEERSKSIFFNPSSEDSPYAPWETLIRDPNKTTKLKLMQVDPKILFEEKNVLFFEPKLKNEKGNHSTFLLLVMISFAFALAWSPYYAIATMLFQTHYNISMVSAGHVAATQEILSLIFNPIVGIIADKVGYKLVLVLLGTIFLALSHSLVLFKMASPYLIILLLSISGALTNCYWPCIPNLVSERDLTKGFALIYCVLNVAYTFSPIFVFAFIKRQTNYDYMEVYIIMISFIAVALTVLLLYLNSKYLLGLNEKSED